MMKGNVSMDAFNKFSRPGSLGFSMACFRLHASDV